MTMEAVYLGVIVVLITAFVVGNGEQTSVSSPAFRQIDGELVNTSPSSAADPGKLAALSITTPSSPISLESDTTDDTVEAENALNGTAMSVNTNNTVEAENALNGTAMSVNTNDTVEAENTLNGTAMSVNTNDTVEAENKTDGRTDEDNDTKQSLDSTPSPVITVPDFTPSPVITVPDSTLSPVITVPDSTLSPVITVPDVLVDEQLNHNFSTNKALTSPEPTEGPSVIEALVTVTEHMNSVVNLSVNTVSTHAAETASSGKLKTHVTIPVQQPSRIPSNTSPSQLKPSSSTSAPDTTVLHSKEPVTLPPSLAKHLDAKLRTRNILVGILVPLVVIAVVIVGFVCYRKRKKTGRGYMTLDDFGSYQGMQNSNYDGEL